MRLTLVIFAMGAAAIGAAFAPALVRAQETPPPGQAALGKRVFQQANCVGCHKWHGGGGGGYGGDALSLRATQLDREQIVETVTCGRPGTGMPYFRRGVYEGDEHPCYGVGRQELGKDMPVEAGIFLRPAEVAAVTDYVLADIKGKGEPSYADCAAFFGDAARVCNVYKTVEPASGRAPEEKRGG